MKESKAMKELHKIREKMANISDKELLKELEESRHKYKNIISASESKNKKIEIKV